MSCISVVTTNSRTLECFWRNVGERESVCVCEGEVARESTRERGGVCVCVCVFVRARYQLLRQTPGRTSEAMYVNERECERECKRECERERERAHAVCVSLGREGGDWGSVGV